MTTTRTRWAVGALGAALLLAGCGSAASTGSSTTAPSATAAPAGGGGAAVLTAYQKTVAAKTASLALDETITGTSSGPVTVTATGQLDFASGDSSFQMSIPSVGSLDMRLIKPTLYMQFPSGLGVPLPAGKTWVSFNLDSPAATSALGASFSQLTDSANQSTEGLSYLQAVSPDGVTTVGPATVRGVPTTEYSATVDLSKAVQGRSPAVQALVQKLQAKFGLSSLPIHVWIDAQGQIRRETVDESLTVSGQQAQVQVTMEFFDFGAPIDVTPPPASQTADLSSMLGSLAGGGSGSGG